MAFGIGLYLFYLILLVPASWVKNRITLPADIEISGVDGTLWQGSIAVLHWRNETFRQLRWSVNWRSLLIGKLAVEIHIADQDALIGQAVLAYRNHWSLSGLQLQTSAAWLGRHIPQLAAVSLTGTLQAEIEEFTWTPAACLKFYGRAHWQQSGIDSLLGNMSLGRPSLSFSCENDKVRIAIDQSAEAINSQTILLLNMGGNYHMQSQLTFGPTFPESLAVLLKTSAQDKGHGIYTINASGQL
ncbi:type II secretion system protein N [Yersinia enterocolitica]